MPLTAVTANANDPLLGIFQLLKDPEGIERKLREIRDAENSLLATQKRVEAEIAEARRVLSDAQSAQERRETALARRESEIAAREEEQRTAYATFIKVRSEFEESKARSYANIARREAGIQVDGPKGSPRLRSVLPG